MSDDMIRRLNNGRAPLNKGGDYVTRRQVEAYVLAFANESILPKLDEITRHYMAQIPELVAKIVSDMARANGLAFHGPNDVAPNGHVQPQNMQQNMPQDEGQGILADVTLPAPEAQHAAQAEPLPLAAPTEPGGDLL